MCGPHFCAMKMTQDQSYGVVVQDFFTSLAALAGKTCLENPKTHHILQLNGRIRTPAPARSLAVRQRSTFTLARPLPRNRPSNPDHEPKRDAFRDTIGRQRNLQPH